MSSLLRSGMFLIGIALLGLGAGNTIVAQFKVAEYEANLASLEPLDGKVLIFGGTTKLHHFSGNAFSRLAFTRAKLDFYHVLRNTGWLMLGTGLLFSVIAIRRQKHFQSPWLPS